MKLLFVLTLVVCCILQYANCSYYAIAQARNPAYPGQCYDPASKTKVKKGFTLYKNCEKWTCSNKYTLSQEGCAGVFDTPKGCRVSRNTSKKFPGCCPKLVCKN